MVTNILEEPTPFIFHPQDAGHKFLLNDCTYLQNYMVPYPRKQHRPISLSSLGKTNDNGINFNWSTITIITTVKHHFTATPEVKEHNTWPP
jgi:hypothetical protein